MGKPERVREVVAGLPSPEYVTEKAEEGWRLVAVEWEREALESEQETGGVNSVRRVNRVRHVREEIPFGLKVSNDCLHLEEEPTETETLLLVLEMIVEDKTMSEVADVLNRRGLKTRRGSEWTQPSVFALLPRVIEVAPRIFSSEAWVSRKVASYPLHNGNSAD